MKYVDIGDWESYFDQDGVKEILDFMAGAGGNFVFHLWIFYHLQGNLPPKAE